LVLIVTGRRIARARYVTHIATQQIDSLVQHAAVATANIEIAVNQPLQPDNLASFVKPAAGEKVKPCCVCKDEKAQRDECMLFSRSDDPQEDCKSMVMKYKECMSGYGFKI
jgi:cytochrome c oxidase assembly protein subunit 17